MFGWSGKTADRAARALLIVCGVAGAVCVAGCGSSGDLPPGLPKYGAQPVLVTFGKPEGLAVNAYSLRAAEITWSQPLGKPYRYRIERARAPEGPFAFVADAVPSKRSYRDGVAAGTYLEDNATYYYRIIALLGEEGPVSEPSLVVKVVTAPPPAPPPNLVAAATASRAVTLKWSPSPSEGVTSYRVERALAAAVPPAFEPVATVEKALFVDGGTPASALRDSTRYLYRVISVNRVESVGTPSAPVEVQTLPPPAPVQKLSAVSREVRCVPLTWEASPEADVVRYDIYGARDAAGPFAKIGTVEGRAVTKYTDGGANPGSLEDEGSYFYRVRAVNAVTAEGADSETVRAVTREVPPEVLEVTAVSARPREVPLSWAASPDTAVVGYEVWRSTADADDWGEVVRLNGRKTNTYRDRGGEKDDDELGLLKDGTEYQYKVIAFNTANVRSSASAVVRAKTKVVPVPPAGLAATTNVAGVVKLAWRPNPEPDVSGYQVESSKKSEDGFRKLAVVPAAADKALAAEEPGLDPGTVKYYRLKALDKEGLESEWGAVVEGRAKPLPDAPAGVQAQPGDGAVTVTWQPPAQRDVVQYRVWSKKFFGLGWDLVAAVDKPEYRVALAGQAKPLTLAVTAVDQDKQESEKSETVKVEPQ